MKAHKKRPFIHDKRLDGFIENSKYYRFGAKITIFTNQFFLFKILFYTQTARRHVSYQ